MGPLIVVLGTPRSGTSMTAGLLAQHGVWTGPCRKADKFNPKGYFENQELAALRFCDAPREDVESLLEKQGYNGGPWLVKHSLTDWYYWKVFNPLFVLCHRPASSSAASLVNYDPSESYKWRKRRADKDYLIMLHIYRSHDCIRVNTNDVIGGDYTAIKELCERFELPFSVELADDFVDPTLWHY